MSHVTNAHHLDSGNRQYMQYNDKNERKKIKKTYMYLKRQHCTNDLVFTAPPRLPVWTLCSRCPCFTSSASQVSLEGLITSSMSANHDRSTELGCRCAVTVEQSSCCSTETVDDATYFQATLLFTCDVLTNRTHIQHRRDLLWHFFVISAPYIKLAGKNTSSEQLTTKNAITLVPFTSGLPPVSEDIPLPQIISWCCMTGRLRFRVLSNGLLLF